MGVAHDARDEIAERRPGEAVLMAERCCLGALLIDSGLMAATAKVNLRVSHFGGTPHQTIFHAMLEREARGSRFDLVVIAADLEAAGKLAAAGGVAYLASLLDRVPDVESVEEYARCVIDGSVARRMAALAGGRR